MSDGKRLLFIGGNPRSGTTALHRLIDAHPDTLIGCECYIPAFNTGEITRAHFEREALTCAVCSTGEAGAAPQVENIEAARARYDGASVVGDKHPAIFRAYTYLWDRFLDCELLYIVRNPLSVAESYLERLRDPGDTWQRGIGLAMQEWNRSVTETLAALEQGRNIVVVSYEQLFLSAAHVRKLFAALKLDPSRADHAAIARRLEEYRVLSTRPVPRNEHLRSRIMMQAAFGPYRKLRREHCIFTRKPLPAKAVNATQPSYR